MRSHDTQPGVKKEKPGEEEDILISLVSAIFA